MSNNYYGSHEQRLDTIIGGDQEHLKRLIASREKFSSDTGADEVPYIQWEKYYHWLEENYGVRLKMRESGVSLEYEVVDEKKYLVFLLEFS